MIWLSVSPMMLYHSSNLKKEMKGYSMLDNCSQASFISYNMLEKKISLMLKKSIREFFHHDINSYNIWKFTISWFYCENKTNQLKLCTHHDLPIKRDEIMSKNDFERWEHLTPIKKGFPDTDHGPWYSDRFVNRSQLSSSSYFIWSYSGIK